ncbi:alpha/beta fold hydrolase [Gloeocapsa sp. PCC 73106]|uniref:alpha/beta fold hydrolase n=1 Tax=Gloeocapsa sp. PCC 73106 TaxID=102232 RepID=UPI0002AC2321|nr:alpha/beta hydrolase [Gloeocapsa sp. PCC 73106]ELR97511.1 putative hydrolase or acyltransferase of alpha/beta superfamily [Gloeocapsa sp. PCC 73106]
MTEQIHYYEWITSEARSRSKPVMVFAHGWGGSCRYWRTTAQTLCDRFDCLLYDLQGFGRSQPGLNADYELETYAENLRELLDNLDLDRVYLNGHSMGASIAVFFASAYPQRLEKLILTCNGIFEYNKLAFETFYFFGGYVVKFRYPWFTKIPGLDRLFMARFLHRSIPAAERRAFLEDFVTADAQAALGTIYTSVSAKAVIVMPQKFAQLQVPTLLISGAKDIIIPASLGRQAAQLNEKIKYVEIPETAHFPMLEDPKIYLEELNAFLSC